ncbi:hypothetical protein HHUSO_G14293 [Huso huso]|uniref:ABC transporter domain-containing protein n=1 Tax=Huso huso TaxID=61971 RepID=A0ABR0ZDX9_HUSHU
MLHSLITGLISGKKQEMASFLQQLRLLLWKNCLSVWRQPVWSLALIIWPLIIFIILAITRSKFPPEKQSACYVAPRNLPSAGFFPFLQTLLCDADSSCKNISFQPQTNKMMISKRLNWSPEDVNRMASFPLNGEFFDKLGIGEGRSAEQRSSLELLTQLTDMHNIWTTMINADFQSLANITSIIDTLNQTVHVEQDGINEMLVSADFLKRVLCNYTLPYVKKTGNSAVDFMGDSYMTFCLSNGPFLEACLFTMNQMFTRVMTENPVEVLNTSVIVLGVIAELQNKSVFWETLLDLPYLFLPGSLDEKVQLGIKLLENMNSILQIVQKGYTQANIPLKWVTPTINEAVHFLQYILHWPGRGVNISLQAVLSGQPRVSTSKEQALLDTVVVPLDKALLLVHFNAFSSYICVGLNGSGAPTKDSLNSLCANNGLQPVFERIDRNKVAEQIFLAWSRGVSRSDVRFAILRVNNLLSLFLPGSEDITSPLTNASTVLNDWLLAVTDSILLSMNKTTRKITFVDMTTAVLHTLREIPGWPSVQRALGVGVGIMEFATDLLKTQTDILSRAEAVAINVQSMIQSLLSNNTFFDAWVGKNINATLETIQEVLQPGRQLACSSITALWADLFTQVTLVQEDWPALLCNQNQSLLLMRLQKTVDPLITKVYMLIDVINGTQTREVTAPQILSAWETLETSYLKCIEVIGRVTQTLGSEYWRAWARNTGGMTANWTAMLQERTLEEVEQLGSELQASVLWPTVKPYFDTAYWIVAYSSQPNATVPPNCTFNSTMSLDCSSAFSWKQFVLMTVALSEEVAKDQTSLLRILRASVLFVQDSFRSYAAELLRQYLTEQANNQPLRNEVLKELMGMIVQLGESSIELLANAASLDHLNSNISTTFLRSVLETFHLLPLEAIWKEGGSSSTEIVSTVLQAAENNQKLLAALNMGPINSTNPSIHKLDSLIEKWLSVGGGLRPLMFSIGETLIMFSSLNQSELAAFKEMLQPLLQANLNRSHATHLVLQILGVFDQVAQSWDEPLALLNGYLKQLQNFLNSDVKPEALLLIQNPYIQTNSNFSQLLNYDRHQVALDMLPFLSPAALQKWVSLGADAPLTVLQQFVLFLPDNQQVELGNIVNNTARLFEAVNLCRMTYPNCTAIIYETLDVVMQAAEALHDINNNSLSILVGLASRFNNSELSLKLQENTSLVLTADLISMLSPLGATTNSSVPASTVYLTVAQTLTFLKQVVSTPDFNMITLQEGLETSNLNITELNNVLRAAGAPNASELVLEISKIVGIQECYKLRPNDSLSCTLELANKLMDLLQRVDLPKEIKGRISAVKSILQYWTEELNGKGSLLRQLEVLYDFTSVSLQNGSLVNRIRTTVTLISDTLMKIKSSMGQLGIESPEQFDTGVQILDEFIQMFVSGTYPYNMTTKTAINNLRLEDIRLYLEITEWYLNKLENITLQNNISGSLYPLFRITEMALANAVSGIELSSSLLSVVNMTKDFVQSILPFDVSDLRKVLQFFTHTIMPNVKVFMDQLLSTLPQNSTDPFLKEQFRQDYSQLLDFASALLEPLAPVNISTASVSIEDIVTRLETMRKNDSEYNMDPLFSLLSKDVETAVKVFKLLQKGIKVFATLESEGAASQTLFNLSSQMMAFDKLIDYMQPLLPAEKRPYVDMAVRVFEMLWDTVIVATEPAEFNAEDIPSLFLDVAKLLLNSTAPLTEQLPEAVVTDLFAVLQDSMQLTLSSSESGFPKDRNLTTEVIGRLQNLVRALIPQPAASILIPMSEVVKIYFETISQDDGPDTWSQIIEQELHYFLPNDSNWGDYISLLQNISALLSQQSQGNTTSLGITGYLLERILGGEGISGNTSLIEMLFEKVSGYLLERILDGEGISDNTSLTEMLFEEALAGWGDASHESPSPLLQTQLHILASLFPDVGHAMGLLNITEARAERILPVLIQLASGAVEKDLWRMTSVILEAVLSSLKETPAWEPVQDILSLEQALSSVVVHSLKVETELNLYVKVFLGNLTASLKRVIQDSGGNLTESIRPILHAVSETASIIREDLLSGRIVSCGDISSTWTDIMHDELALNQTRMEELCNQTCFPDDLNSAAGILRQLMNTTVSGMGKEDSIDGKELIKDLKTLYQAALSYYESLRHFYTEILAATIDGSTSVDSSIPALIDDLSTQHIVLGVSAALNPFLQQASVLPGLKQHIEAADWIMNYAMQNNYTGQDNCDNSSMSRSCKGTDELEMHSEKMIRFLLAVTKDPALAGRLLQGTWECVSHNSTLFSAYSSTAGAVMHLLKDDIELFLNVSLSLIMDAEADPSQLWKEALSCLLKDLFKNVNSSSLHQIWNGDILKVIDGQLIDQVLKNAIRVLIRIKILEDGSLVYKVMEQLLAVNDTGLILTRTLKLVTWWKTTSMSGMEFAFQAAQKLYNLVKAILSAIMQMNIALPPSLISYSDMVMDVLGVFVEGSQFPLSNGTIAPLAAYTNKLRNYVQADQSLEVLLPLAWSSFNMSKSWSGEREGMFIQLLPILYNSLLRGLSPSDRTSSVNAQSLFTDLVTVFSRSNKTDQILHTMETLRTCHTDLGDCTSLISKIYEIVFLYRQKQGSIQEDDIKAWLKLSTEMAQMLIGLSDQPENFLNITQDFVSSILPLIYPSQGSSLETLMSILFTILKNIIENPLLIGNEMPSILSLIQQSTQEHPSTFSFDKFIDLSAKLEAALKMMQCTDSGPSSVLNCILQSTQSAQTILQLFNVTTDTQDVLVAVKSITEFWLSQVSNNGAASSNDIGRQLQVIFNFTTWLFQNQALMVLVNDDLSSITANLKDVESTLMSWDVTSTQGETLLTDIQAILHLLQKDPRVGVDWSDVSFGTNQLETLAANLRQLQWQSNFLRMATLWALSGQHNNSYDFMLDFANAKLLLSTHIPQYVSAQIGSLLELMTGMSLPADSTNGTQVLELLLNDLARIAEVVHSNVSRDRYMRNLQDFVQTVFKHYSTSVQSLIVLVLDEVARDLKPLNGLLQKNINMPKETQIYLQVSNILEELRNSISMTRSQIEVNTYLNALDQMLAVFNPLLTPEQNIYLNASAQMIKAFTYVLSAPENFENVVHATDIISASLDHLLAAADNITLLSGQKVKDVLDPLIADPAIITQILWQLANSSLSQLSMEDQMQLANKLLNNLASRLPAEHSSYLNATLLRILKTLPALSSGTNITGNIFNLTRAVSDFLLEPFNATGFPISNITSAGNIVGSSAFDNLGASIRRVTEVYFSNATDLVKAAGITVIVASELQNVLKMVPPSYAVNKTLEVIKVIKDNVGSLLGINSTNWANAVLQLLANTAELVPPELPYARQFKNLVINLVKEAQEEFLVLSELSQILQTMFTTNWAADNVTAALENLKIKKAQMSTVTGIVCELEKLRSVQALYDLVPMNSGIMCQTVSPAIQAVFSLSYGTLNWGRNLTFSLNTLVDTLYYEAVRDPNNYNVNANWSSAFVDNTLNFNTSAFNFLNITNTTAAPTKVSDLILNPAAFMSEIQKWTGMPTDAIDAMMQTIIPDNSLQLLAWLTDLRYCDSPGKLNLTQSGELVYRAFCKLGPLQQYSFVVIVLEHLDLLEFIYKIILTSDMQNVIEALMRLFQFIMGMFQKLAPAIKLLISYLQQIQRLNLVANSEFKELVAGNRATISSKATFNTLAGAMCYRGFFSLFGVSQTPSFMDSKPSTQGNLNVDEIIKKFDIPRNATPFCLALYLDMVNTTGGAVAWAFIKPMLLGKILYTPDTPETRAIMEKSNDTLQQLDKLKMYSQDWIDATKLIFDSAQLLEKILPLLLRSLQNPFVQHFIKLQTNVNVNNILNMLQTYSNLTKMLEENRKVMDQLTVLSKLMLNLSSCVNFNRIQPVSSIAEMNVMAKELLKTKELYASVIFKMPPKSSRRKRSAGAGISLPAEMKYTIRMVVQNSMRTDRIRNPSWTPGSYVSSNKNQRYNRGFINLQESIDRAIIDIQAGKKVKEPAVQLQAFPYPCYFKDNFLNSMSNSFPLALMVAWVLFIAAFVKKLVHERELRLHEYMKMMGVNTSSHFFAWFIESACFLLVTITIMTIILKAGKIFPNSNGFIIFLFLCDYGFSILAMSFLISTFFDNTNVAGLSGSLVYIICFFPFIIMVTIESTLTFSTKSLLCLFAPTCFSYAGQYIGRYEGQNIGIQWDNSYVSPLANDTTSFGWLCWLLLIDSLIYFTVGWYIRNVFPGKYGIASPWYFPVLPSFWAECCGFNTCRKDSGRGLLFTNIMLQSGNIDHKNKGNEGFTSEGEAELEGLPVGVSLHGLTKLYGQTVAIQNLNLNFYEGHVTALLGHNGAGKTTTMSLLTGLYSPSSGSVLVYGKDMQTHMDAVHRDMGVCMQYDVLFEHLTVKEHLLLYGQIKSPGWNKHELNQQVRNTLKETGMYAHRHKRVDTLSGGMKRKLSISIAFIGGSKTVVLDEPTTGVDPCSRRSIWDIVIRHKTGRTIILSTHHLDEAEVLSDRIAFLERGGLKCCGSPFHLKEKLGQGYNLTLTRRVPPPGSEDYCMPDTVTRFIQSHLPEAQLKEKVGADLVYALPPFGAQRADAYRSLLSELDRSLDTLRLGCYGISDTTLEEVFLQMTKDDENKDTAWSNTQMVVQVPSGDTMVSEYGTSSYSVSSRQALTGSSSLGGARLFTQKVVGMLVKRIHHSRRDWKGLLAQIILPVLFVIAAMGMGTIKNGIQEYPEINLSPSLYGYDGQSVFFGLGNPSASDLVSKMMSFPGIDNVCLYNPGNEQCLNKEGSGDWTSSGIAPASYKPCNCNTTVQVCPRDDYVPPHKKVPSLQTVYNVSQLNVENYLLSTANSFIQNRYGGWVFGNPLPVDLRMDVDPVPANRTLTKVWYNPEGYHTMPAYLNSLDNFILRANLPPGVDPQKYAIFVYSQPYTGGVLDEDAVVQSLVGVLVALCILTGYSIMTASFVIYEVMEYQTGAKRLQHISGVGEIFYWIVNFIYDMTLYVVPVALSIAVIAAFQLPAFNYRQNLGAVSLLLVLFGFGTFPWMYLLAGTFKNAEMAFICYISINLFIAVNTIISTSVVYFLSELRKDDLNVKEVYRVMSYVFLIFPQFSFGNGLMELSRVQLQVDILAVFGIDSYKNPFSMDVLGWMFVALAVQGSLCFLLRLLLNTWLLRKMRILMCRMRAVMFHAVDEDPDVKAEQDRVDSGQASGDLLQLNKLSKLYQNIHKKVLAVNNISVGIPAGECFGLLGVNGAGKTTTFKMLTAEIFPSNGNALVKDTDGSVVDIMDGSMEGINIGYCPQVDALDDLLTGEEHLYYYARIRGIPSQQIHNVVMHLLQRLELLPHKDKPTCQYSCGTKRKLSTALALIGCPQILLLDEPSSGMDPKSKRHLWNIISEELKEKCAVVLTSHSMEECEALCTRLAIMVKGRFRCLGSLQHIKNRFGSGFTVKMHLTSSSLGVEHITTFMQSHFPSTFMKDHHSGTVEYHVPVAPGGVAVIFDQLECNKASLSIKHFSVSQTTLDEVFINFAKESSAEESEASSELSNQSVNT